MFLIITIVFGLYILFICFVVYESIVAWANKFVKSALYLKYKAKISKLDLIDWDFSNVLSIVCTFYLGVIGLTIYFVLINYFKIFEFDFFYIKTILLLLLLSPFSYYQFCLFQRNTAIKKELGDVLELILTALKSGISYNNCLDFIIKYMKNKYVVIELKRLKNDLLLNGNENIAWDLFKKRVCHDKNLLTIISILQESSTLGVSSFDELLVMIKNNKKVREFEIEEKSINASSKSKFIFLLFAMPSILMFIIGPYFIFFIDHFKQLGI